MSAKRLKRLDRLALTCLLLVSLMLACSGDEKEPARTGHYEEICTACGTRWVVDVVASPQGNLEVTITVTNTGELGPLELRAEHVEAVLFNQRQKEEWLRDYAVARAEGRLETGDLTRLPLRAKQGTRLGVRLEPSTSWTGTFEARNLPADTQALMISFLSYQALERPGSPSAWTSRDARRPFINLGEEIRVAAVPTGTPRSGPRQISLLSTIGATSTSAQKRYRFEVNPWTDRVQSVTVMPPLPGSDSTGAFTAYTLTRQGAHSVLELRVPATAPARSYTLTVRFADGLSASIEFSHSP